MEHAECYRAIERELERRGLDYEIHGLPGAEDIVRFEEYWLTNLPESTKLFPAIFDADEAIDLDGMILRAVQTHTAQDDDDTAAYYVVLCGDGWTEQRVEQLRAHVGSRLRADVSLTIVSLSAFTAASSEKQEPA